MVLLFPQARGSDRGRLVHGAADADMQPGYPESFPVMPIANGMPFDNKPAMPSSLRRKSAVGFCQPGTN